MQVKRTTESLAGSRAPLAITCLLLGLVYAGCEHSVAGRFGDPAALTAEGWVAFEAGDLLLALSKFNLAMEANPMFADAHNGAGWTYGRLGNFSLAAERFDTALNLQPEWAEALAGASLAYHAANRYLDAIDAGRKALDLAPNFIFEHDPTVDSLDVRITLALSYFSVGDFQKAAEQMDLIDPTGRPHSTNPDELIRAIMRFFGQIR